MGLCSWRKRGDRRETERLLKAAYTCLAYRRSFMFSIHLSDLTEAPTSPARAFPQAITSELVLQTSSIIHAPVQRSLKSYFTKHSDKPGRKQSVPAVHRNSLNISCSLYFLGNEGGIHLDLVVAAYITVYLHAFNAKSLKELCKSSNNKNTPSKYLLNAICVAQCLKLQAGFERSVD